MTRGLRLLGTVLILAGCQQREPVAEVEEAPAAAAPVAEQPTETVGADVAVAPLPAGDPNRAAQFQRLPPPDPELFPNLKQMAPQFDVWFDAEHQRVVLQSGVCLREGPLELFACIHQWVDDEYKPGEKLRRGTKEYESVVTINTTAKLVHAALLAAGAEEGDPATFDPVYRPATGSEVEVTLYWKDQAGQPQQAPAQQWIRNVKTGEAMTYPWVFAGSGFWADPDTGQKEYLAENGNLICVSNFSDAVLDLPIKSPQENSLLLFEAFTERIPPMGTVVTVVLTPQPVAE